MQNQENGQAAVPDVSKKEKHLDSTYLVALLVATALLAGGIAALGVYWWQVQKAESHERELKKIQDTLQNFDMN